MINYMNLADMTCLALIIIIVFFILKLMRQNSNLSNYIYFLNNRDNIIKSAFQNYDLTKYDLIKDELGLVKKDLNDLDLDLRKGNLGLVEDSFVSYDLTKYDLTEDCLELIKNDLINYDINNITLSKYGLNKDVFGLTKDNISNKDKHNISKHLKYFSFINIFFTITLFVLSISILLNIETLELRKTCLIIELIILLMVSILNVRSLKILRELIINN